jgi:hypothetical protein
MKQQQILSPTIKKGKLQPKLYYAMAVDAPMVVTSVFVNVLPPERVVLPVPAVALAAIIPMVPTTVN